MVLNDNLYLIFLFYFSDDDGDDDTRIGVDHV